MAMTQSDRSEALAERVFEATIGALELNAIYLGMKLGLYGALASGGSHRVGARRAGGDRGALRAASGSSSRRWPAFSRSHRARGSMRNARSYGLPAADEGQACSSTLDDPAHVAPLARMLAGDRPGAARGGDRGIPQRRGGRRTRDYGTDFRHGQGGINRPAFSTSHDRSENWLPAVAGRRTLGCSMSGRHAWPRWAAVRGGPRSALATHVPGGALYDGPTTRDRRLDRGGARHAAQEAGVEDRVQFELRRRNARWSGARPLRRDPACWRRCTTCRARSRSLAAAREVLAEDGVMLVADERVAEAFAAPGDEIERMMYGWSIAALPADADGGR